MTGTENEHMSDMQFRLMVLTMNVVDILFSHIEKRVAGFGIRPGMTVVDYGCGPGRYTVHYSRLAGRQGKVYAVDIHAMAIDLFFAIRDKNAFLAELKRIAKPDGTLILDDGHQPRSQTLAQIAAAGSWTILAETKDHLTLKPAG